MDKCQHIFETDMDEIFNIITNEYEDEYDKLNKDNYCDLKHYIIDFYISQLNRNKDNREIVELYGVFDAIKLYDQTYGKFRIELESDIKNYNQLAYLIAYDWLCNKFENYTDLKTAYKEYIESEVSDDDEEEIESPEVAPREAPEDRASFQSPTPSLLIINKSINNSINNDYFNNNLTNDFLMFKINDDIKEKHLSHGPLLNRKCIESAAKDFHNNNINYILLNDIAV